MPPTLALMTNGVNRNNLGLMADYVYTHSATTVFDVEAGTNFNQEGNILTPTALDYTPSAGRIACLHGPESRNESRSAYHVVLRFTTLSARPFPRGPITSCFPSKATPCTLAERTLFALAIDVRDHRRLGGDPGVTSGSFAFTNSFTSATDDSTTAGTLGHSWASLHDGTSQHLERRYQRQLCAVQPVHRLVPAGQLAPQSQADLERRHPQLN